MHLSSILIFTAPNKLETLLTTFGELPQIEVHYHCQKSGRVVVIQEAIDEATEMEGLRQIKLLPHVIAAEMVYHHVEENEESNHQVPAPQHHFGGASI